MGGENWETREVERVCSDRHETCLDLATFGALQSLRNFAPLLALLGTAAALAMLWSLEDLLSSRSR